jgi:hypothetical protein
LLHTAASARGFHITEPQSPSRSLRPGAVHSTIGRIHCIRCIVGNRHRILHCHRYAFHADGSLPSGTISGVISLTKFLTYFPN